MISQSGIAHNRPKLEMIQMSINQWMDKQNVRSVQWNSTQKWKGINYLHMLQHEWASEHHAKW